jgi:hypothetical protein
MDESWFRPYVEGIRRRPAMYLRIPTAAGLGALVDGYRQARWSLRNDDLRTEDLEFERRFESWLRKRAGGGANFDWPMLIDLVVGHPASIAEFFELWDLFHEQEGLEHVAGNVWAGGRGFGQEEYNAFPCLSCRVVGLGLLFRWMSPELVVARRGDRRG